MLQLLTWAPQYTHSLQCPCNSSPRTPVHLFINRFSILIVWFYVKDLIIFHTFQIQRAFLPYQLRYQQDRRNEEIARFRHKWTKTIKNIGCKKALVCIGRLCFTAHVHYWDSKKEGSLIWHEICTIVHVAPLCRYTKLSRLYFAFYLMLVTNNYTIEPLPIWEVYEQQVHKN